MSLADGKNGVNGHLMSERSQIDFCHAFYPQNGMHIPEASVACENKKRASRENSVRRVSPRCTTDDAEHAPRRISVTCAALPASASPLTKPLAFVASLSRTMVIMFSAASFVYNTASGFVYGPPAAHNTAVNAKKRRRPRPGDASSSSGSRGSGFASRPQEPRSSTPSHQSHYPPSSLDKNKAQELVDQINQDKDLYQVLGVDRSANLEDIRRAYISRSRVCHPDKLPSYAPCTPAFQKLSFAYETLSKPATRRLYDLSGGRDFTDSIPGCGDETLNGVLYATFCEFLEGDFAMIRVFINALNEGNPGLNIGEDAINNLESAFRRVRSFLLTGSKYVRVIRFELIRLYEIQQSLRALSIWNISGRLRLTLALARVTLSIPMAIDRAMREDDDDDDETSSTSRSGILPRGVVGLLGATVAVLEKGEKATLWGLTEPVGVV